MNMSNTSTPLPVRRPNKTTRSTDYGATPSPVPLGVVAVAPGVVSAPGVAESAGVVTVVSVPVVPGPVPSSGAQPRANRHSPATKSSVFIMVSL